MIDKQISIDDKIFVKTIEKRVRKDLRINKKIGKSKIIKLLDNKTKEFEIATLILKDIFGEIKKIQPMKKADKDTLIPTNIDREIKKDLESYKENKSFEKKEKLILQNILESEILRLCKIKQLKHTSLEDKDELIESLESETPNTKFSLAKSFKKIRLALK